MFLNVHRIEEVIDQKIDAKFIEDLTDLRFPEFKEVVFGMVYVCLSRICRLP